MQSNCSQCGKVNFCLPMGKDAAKICHACYTLNQSNPETATVPEVDTKAIFEGFAEFAKEHGIDLNELNGEALANMLSRKIAQLVAHASMFGIHVRKIEFAEVSTDKKTGALAMKIEGSHQEFDEKYLPILKKLAQEAAIAEAGAVPEHIRAAVKAQGDTIGRFNA